MDVRIAVEVEEGKVLGKVFQGEARKSQNVVNLYLLGFALPPLLLLLHSMEGEDPNPTNQFEEDS